MLYTYVLTENTFYINKLLEEFQLKNQYYFQPLKCCLLNILILEIPPCFTIKFKPYSTGIY